MQEEPARSAEPPQQDGSPRVLPGLHRACQALAAGGAVVVPNPFPLASGIVSTRAPAVNALKRRRLDQNVAVSMHDRRQWNRVAPCIDLPSKALNAVDSLMGRRLTVLLPMRTRTPYPDWLAPAIRDGYLAAFNGYWAPTASLWERFPRLYGSSANITGEPPVAGTVTAAALFGPDCVIVDADALGEPTGPRSSSTMVRIDRTARLHLYRSGAHDATEGRDPDEFLRDLASAIGLPHRPGEDISRVPQSRRSRRHRRER